MNLFVKFIRELYKVQICLIIMEWVYILIGLIGSFILGFLAGFFIGLGKFKRTKTELVE